MLPKKRDRCSLLLLDTIDDQTMSIITSAIYPVNTYGGFNEGADGKRWIDPRNRVYRTMRSQLVKCTRQVIDDSQFEAVDTVTVSNDSDPSSEVGGVHISDQRLTSTRLTVPQRTFVAAQTIPFSLASGEFVGAISFDAVVQDGANFDTADFPVIAIPAPQAGVYHVQVTISVAAYTGLVDGFLRFFLGRVDNLAETEFPTPDFISSSSFLRKVGDGALQFELSGFIYLRRISDTSTSNHAVAVFFQRPDDTMPVTVTGSTITIALLAADS